MSTKRTETTAAKDPADWVTGDEPMTGPQESYLNTLAQEAGTDAPTDLTKAEASQKIEELQEATGRGEPAPKARKRVARKKTS
ncbi:Uncharacterized protein OS=Mycobacterium vaccae ATCC 25954 GN=MVAC_05412 PE=4 SV=1: DUF3072 [Gemmata massiliana]|uniref:DUF3072 domain-containing protein n=1 Tax=Gemmata massiliana TaxID=1210884 RepID=A0A6P2DJS0_9BACT|nr:DUF3072 domain-containing protein [Gemmata massiliana]VTS00710.1 Uncharacterized protein OS=Mycobacterium vaccae ATCC 25954 GN=MVAC_05412 PE=4 SV=1: DUF3072 [Gemmata massiliana]